MSFLRCLLNIADMENYTNLHDMLPTSWSLPSLGNALRHEIEPPALQQATFDDVVSDPLYVRNLIEAKPFFLIITDLQNGHNTKRRRVYFCV